MTELYELAKDSPLMLVILLGAGGILAFLERAFALSGPVTKLAQWWQGRELAKLRREALLRAERRRIQQEEESAIIASLRAEVAWLREEVTRLRADTAPMAAARNTARPPVPPR